MLNTTVTPAGIAVALGIETVTEAQEAQWSMWIDDALMLIQARADQLEADEARIGQNPLDYVIRESVVTHIRRPDDATQVTVSIDDGSTSKSYRSGKGRITILDEWWSLLGLVGESGAFSIDALAVGSIHLPWCSLNFGATYCSCGADIAGHPIYEDPEW